MNQPLHENWDSIQENSPFPFVDGSTLRSTNRALILPVQAIRDLVIATPLLSTAARLAEVERTISSVILRFKQANTLIATATVTSTDNGWIQLTNNGGTTSGRIRIDQVAFSTLFGADVQVYTFNAAGSTIVPWATFYRPLSGLRGFRLPDGTIVTGDVTIVAGDGLTFDADGHLNAVGESDRNIPDSGLIPRGIAQVTIDDTVVQQVVSPQDSAINGRTIALAGKPVAIQLTNPSSDVVRFEVVG